MIRDYCSCECLILNNLDGFNKLVEGVIDFPMNWISHRYRVDACNDKDIMSLNCIYLCVR